MGFFLSDRLVSLTSPEARSPYPAIGPFHPLHPLKLDRDPLT
ncbi:hypothetical protein [Oscillatoria sp. HE19RPO]|nr:hypothetical protein [Oscillatoria sp. HE19RPO]